MTVFWIRKTTTWSDYFQNIEYLSDPSVDLIDHFKEEIVTFEDLTKHEDYVQCNHVELSKGHLLFILGDRVEVIVKPDKESGILYFISCVDIASI
ncbi:MAG: hypothetical protein ACREA7_00625 [Nitrosotalea sp.]